MAPQLIPLLGGLALAFMLATPPAHAHVALTFPPARKYNFDFLDTFRTVTPCGMFKGDIHTSVQAGKPLKVTWHLGYPHRGGFKLELLDREDRPLRDLTPQDQYIGDDDVTIQEYTVTIPEDLRCQGCTLRLVRQALEWGAQYRFQSCSNIDIVSIEDYRNDCSGHGSLKSGGVCECRRMFFGDKCQYMNDCEDDSDCNGHGQCIDNPGSTALPKKECYCNMGFFGQNCQKASVLKDKGLNQSSYEEIKLRGEDVKFMWRFIGGAGNEVEAAIMAKTSSFVAIGWRPEDIAKSCQRFPEDAPAPVSKDFHAMDCQDIVVAKVKGDLSNIGDYYTRDRSTPRRDAFYGGEDDLTAAIAWESDGVTTVIFRKPIRGTRDSGRADHDFSGELKLIWAMGQSGNPFFREDELKYHGGNRGSYTLAVSGTTKAGASSTLSLLALTLVMVMIGSLS